MSTPQSDDKHLWVTWDEYNRLVEGLALKVYESGFKFDMVLCLARGGVRPGDHLTLDHLRACLGASSPAARPDAGHRPDPTAGGAA